VLKGRFTPAGDRANYDVMPDGRRFVIVKPAEEDCPVPQLTVVLNWASTLGEAFRQR
jgi:hypothetical protein